MKHGLMKVLFFLLWMTAAGSNVFGAEWTLMIYLDADNNLEGAGIEDYLEMAAVGSSSDVNIVVQFDRISGYDTSYGDWRTCKRFLVMPGDTPTTKNQLEDIGEANMGDPATLTTFVDWATARFPAEYYALILWNHGGGWREQWEALQTAIKNTRDDDQKAALLQQIEKIQQPGYKAVCWDDTNGSDALYTREIKTALEATVIPPDLVGFDACLMGMVEVAFELKDTGAWVMVGSEETEPWGGWPYDRFIGDLTENALWSPEQLGIAIVEHYAASYGNSETQSAINLFQMDPLAQHITTLSDLAMQYWDNDRFIIQNAAQDVMTALNSAVIHERHGDAWPGAYGLAIYFPATAAEFDADYNGSVIDFANDTSWDVFLTDYHAVMSRSWIASARRQTQQFYYSEHVDLYDFCQNIVNTAEPCGMDYRIDESVLFDFEDISAGGNALNLGDDDWAIISIPFEFGFYCNTFNAVSIGSNGLIYFQNTLHPYQNVCLPGAASIDHLIAPFWDDLNPTADGGVFWEIKGSEPDRRLIIQWHQVPHYARQGTATFQAILFEQNSEILFQYEDVQFGDPQFDGGASASIGVQELLGNGNSYACNDPILVNGGALRFAPSLSPQIADIVPRISRPGRLIRISGENFGNMQAGSVMHLNRIKLGAAYPGIVNWSDTEILIQIPRFKCPWFNGNPYRNARIAVTVGGVNSNPQRIRIFAPDFCP